MSQRTRTGKIDKFDGSTWWGAVRLDGPDNGDVVEFHATCFLRGAGHDLPRVGDRVQIVFSDDSGRDLLSVRPVTSRSDEPSGELHLLA